MTLEQQLMEKFENGFDVELCFNGNEVKAWSNGTRIFIREKILVNKSNNFSLPRDQTGVKWMLKIMNDGSVLYMRVILAILDSE